MSTPQPVPPTPMQPTPEELEFRALVKQFTDACAATKRTPEQMQAVLVTVVDILRAHEELPYLTGVNEVRYCKHRLAEKVAMADKLEATVSAQPRTRPGTTEAVKAKGV